ncbi:sorbosone dehydrogenase family protein [Hyphomicrobium sp. D-2]|uniref:PQQ-dependent sugar dehydrogenase n=1 Tax=Hyphomicrobium sp. D-2 TaxID=3041621 RepID=UPI002458053B|nr:sorbosone dehydrogenase family protein [Hyphomicrobium sp. D-2]MDH4982186.1 sorbosone dehydrogenase family protein [Hyphomicrobium sp. D-2]
MTAVGWTADGAPVAAEGLKVSRFADGFIHPRWVYTLPNGDVLVAEASSLPLSNKGLVGSVMEHVMRNAGAVQETSPDRIVLLRDADGDGVAEKREIFLEGLLQPFGMALLDGHLYIANTNALVRVPYTDGDLTAAGPPETVAALPFRADDNGHWTRNVIASPDGSRLFVTVGSISNIAEQGMDIEQGRAMIYAVNPATGTLTEYATGLRNPNGMGFAPGTNTLWTVVNERDGLGDDLPPDYLTSVKEGGFYGWPWAYWGRADHRFKADEIPPGTIERTIRPDYALGGHTAALGLVFNDKPALGPQWQGGAFVGLHGSWNRREPSGYRVIYVPFTNGQPSGMPVDVLTGFLDAQSNAMGRPVGVDIAGDGALLVADDVGKVIWRVAPAMAQ